MEKKPGKDGDEVSLRTDSAYLGVEGRGQERNIKERMLAFGGGDPGGTERWPRKLMTTFQISRLPRAQGRLWRPGPFQLSHSPLILCAKALLDFQALPSCGLSTLQRALEKPPWEKRPGRSREPHIYPEETLNSSGPREGGGGTGEGVKFFHFHSQLSGG